MPTQTQNAPKPNKSLNKTVVTTLDCLNLAGQLIKLFRSSVNASHAAVLYALLKHRSQKGEIFPNYKTLEAEAACSSATLTRALGFWREKGVISWEKGRFLAEGKGIPNRYTFNVDAAQRMIKDALPAQPEAAPETAPAPETVPAPQPVVVLQPQPSTQADVQRTKKELLQQEARLWSEMRDVGEKYCKNNSEALREQYNALLEQHKKLTAQIAATR